MNTDVCANYNGILVIQYIKQMISMYTTVTGLYIIYQSALVVASDAVKKGGVAKQQAVCIPNYL